MVEESPGRIRSACQPGDVETSLPTVWMENTQKLNYKSLQRFININETMIFLQIQMLKNTCQLSDLQG